MHLAFLNMSAVRDWTIWTGISTSAISYDRCSDRPLRTVPRDNNTYLGRHQHLGIPERWAVSDSVPETRVLRLNLPRRHVAEPFASRECELNSTNFVEIGAAITVSSAQGSHSGGSCTV